MILITLFLLWTMLIHNEPSTVRAMDTYLSQDLAILSKAISTGMNITHLVYIGDSLLRYQYLAFVYSVHFHVAAVPTFVIRETLFSTWNEFYSATSDIFRNHMLCDCFRTKDVDYKLSAIRENRYYYHPNLPLHLTYFEKFGDLSAHGLEFSEIEKYQYEEDRKDSWEFDWEGILTERVAKLNPQVSAVIMNAGLHPHKQTMQSINKILNAAMTVAPHVFWLETTPTRTHIEGTHSELDALIKAKFCNHASNSLSTNCTFVDFPSYLYPLVDGNFWDTLHFKHSHLYLERNKPLLDLLGLTQWLYYPPVLQ